ncbi:MAG: hypothetical protein DRH24_20440 [Deltaproteobacteria bacterium]|nr:MAG: hypothetical protein DRH24_20440 [Deltaproteobacteria bacterium]
MSDLIQNLKPNWQFLGKMSICNDDFGASMPSLSLTLNVEPLNLWKKLNFSFSVCRQKSVEKFGNFKIDFNNFKQLIICRVPNK